MLSSITKTSEKIKSSISILHQEEDLKKIVKMVFDFEKSLTGIEDMESAERIVLKGGFEDYDNAIEFYIWYYNTYILKQKLTQSEKEYIIEKINVVCSAISELDDFWNERFKGSLDNYNFDVIEWKETTLERIERFQVA